jgi:hypothetical protein
VDREEKRAEGKSKTCTKLEREYLKERLMGKEILFRARDTQMDILWCPFRKSLNIHSSWNERKMTVSPGRTKSWCLVISQEAERIL